MPNSMTGYGRYKDISGGFDVTVEIKAVNHRYFDTNIRTPRSFAFLEETVRKYLQKHIGRGKLDVFIHMHSIDEGDKSVKINKSICQSYLNAFNEIADTFSLENDITVSKLARFSDIFEVDYREYEEKEIFGILEPILEKALRDFLDMRKKEGARLCEDMLSRIDELKKLVMKIDALMPESIKEYENKLREKMEEYIGTASFDENRFMTEIAIFSDKVATFEESTRLKSHFVEFADLVDKDKQVGKKLDFIVQEMNREINTICSKCQSFEISKIGIDAKALIEAIREQVQNIE